MRSRLQPVLFLGLLLVLTPGPGAAEEVRTTATVQNGLPEIVSFEVLLDARLGIFRYEVRATDPNGAPDLDRAIFHFLDRDDRLWTHSDRDGTREGNAMVWRGIAHPDRGLTHGPFRVHLHVYDRLDAEAVGEAPVTILSPVLDKVRETPDERAGPEAGIVGRKLVPLLQQAEVQAPPQTALVILASASMVAAVFAAARTTASPKGTRARPAQRRSGGRPGRR